MSLCVCVCVCVCLCNVFAGSVFVSFILLLYVVFMHFCMYVCGMWCRFIDRFNATSLWATHSILESNSPVGRANIFEKLVELAIKFEQLGNFSGVMAIVTGLQQGCITRLNETKKIIKQTSIDKLSRLQVWYIW